MIEVKEIVKIPIVNIMVNSENPRHDPIIGLSESFIMQQLINNSKDASAMYKLITDIFKNGWFPQSIITITYDEKNNNYIAWDGNRRLTALKILQNPNITTTLKKFTYTQIQSIYNMSREIKDLSFYEVSCYIAPSFNECADYIRTIHTTDTGALPWNKVAIKRFEDKLGIKNLFSQLLGYCPNAKKYVGTEFPVSRFEKLASSKIGKDYLGIEFKDNTLICLSSIQDIEFKLIKILKDINFKKINTKTVINAKSIKSYLYPQTETPKDKINLDSQVKVCKDKINNQQYLFFNNINDELSKNSDIQSDKLNINMPNFPLIDSQAKKIELNKDIIFRSLNILKLNVNNERSIGIKSIAHEVQSLSIGNKYFNYPIAFSFLLRSLLEQTSIYFLINKGLWYDLVRNNNNRDLRLEQIISYISSHQFVLDDTTKRSWTTCFDTSGNKDYFDLVIHHPHKVVANTIAISHISDIGLFAIIQYFINF